MSRYRITELRMWGDQKFMRLSRPQPNAQTIWQFLLTGPFTTNIPGVNLCRPSMIASWYGWDESDAYRDAYRHAFAEVIAEGMARASGTAALIVLPGAWKLNVEGKFTHQPQSINALKAWRPTWTQVPECTLKTETWAGLKGMSDAMSDGYRKAFAMACPKPSRIQEQVTGTETGHSPTGNDCGGDRSPPKSSPRRRRKPSGRVPGYTELVAHFTDRFVAHNDGAKPTWDAKTGALVKQLLEAHGLEECKRRTDVLFSSAPPWITSRDIPTLRQHFDKLAKPHRETARSGGAAQIMAQRALDLEARGE